MADFNLNETEAPENKEKVFITPGFRKLTVDDFTYEHEEEGKTPLILMKCSAKDSDGNRIEFVENLYLSGKLNKQGVRSSVVRLQELFKGLTGDKIKETLKSYTYTKKGANGTIEEFSIPNPTQILEILIKKCKGKTAIFKVGGEIAEDGQVFAKLAYSSFLYYVNRQGELCKYTQERDFTEAEYKFAVQKRKAAPGSPVSASGIADTKTLDEL